MCDYLQVLQLGSVSTPCRAVLSDNVTAVRAALRLSSLSSSVSHVHQNEHTCTQLKPLELIEGIVLGTIRTASSVRALDNCPVDPADQLTSACRWRPRKRR
jgi:hypothetical protein